MTVVRFETAEQETTLDWLPDGWSPRKGDLIEWGYPASDGGQLGQGVYVVEGVTHLLSHGTLRIRVALAFSGPLPRRY